MSTNPTTVLTAGGTAPTGRYCTGSHRGTRRRTRPQRHGVVLLCARGRRLEDRRGRPPFSRRRRPRRIHGAGTAVRGPSDGRRHVGGSTSELITLFYIDFSGNLHKFDMDSDLNTVGTNSRPIAPRASARTGHRDYSASAITGSSRTWSAHRRRQWGRRRKRPADRRRRPSGQGRGALTDNPIEEAGMRPWLARQGDLVLMADRQRQHTVVEIRLDLAVRRGSGRGHRMGWVGRVGWLKRRGRGRRHR